MNKSELGTETDLDLEPEPGIYLSIYQSTDEHHESGPGDDSENEAVTERNGSNPEHNREPGHESELAGRKPELWVTIMSLCLSVRVKPTLGLSPSLGLC